MTACPYSKGCEHIHPLPVHQVTTDLSNSAQRPPPFAACVCWCATSDTALMRRRCKMEALCRGCPQCAGMWLLFCSKHNQRLSSFKLWQTCGMDTDFWLHLGFSVVLLRLCRRRCCGVNFHRSRICSPTVARIYVGVACAFFLRLISCDACRPAAQTQTASSEKYVNRDCDCTTLNNSAYLVCLSQNANTKSAKKTKKRRGQRSA